MMLEERAATIAADLGADEEAVREDLENLVTYSVPLEEAERSLRRKYGNGDSGDEPVVRKEITDVTIGDDRVSLTAMVQSAGRRPIQYEGEERVITEGELADGSGTIGYTAWEDFELVPGKCVSIEGASVREWDGRPELNLGQQTRIRDSDEALDIDPPTDNPRPLETVTPGDRDVTVAVRVLESEERTIEGRDGQTPIRSGVIADDSARLPFTDWEARASLDDGASVRIDNAYVREYRGVPTVNLSRFSSLEVLSEDIEATETASVASIGAALAAGPAYDVAVTGAIVDIREGSGLIERCPECQRLTRQGRCRSHGSVDGVSDLRVRAVLDDGTGSITVILDTKLTEVVYGGDLNDAVEAAREAMDQSVVTDRIRTRMLGREWRVRGQLRIDDFGGTIDAVELDPVTAPADDIASSVLTTLEAGQ